MRKSGPVKDVADLILWMRKQQIQWSTLTVGTITIEGADLKLAAELPQTTTEPTKPRSIFTDYGASLLEEAAESEGMTSVVDEVD